MPWARASELDRVVWCTASKILPPSRLISDNVKKAGAWGTFVHYWKETGELLTSSDYFDSFKKTFDKKWEIVGSPELRETLWPVNGNHEVAYAYDCETGTVGQYLETNKEAWKASQPFQYVTGTCDYEGEVEGLVWVDDLKTGAMFDTPADRSLQLYFYGLCASIFRWGDVQDVVVSITHWPKYPLSIYPDRRWGYLPAKRVKRFQSLLTETYDKMREKMDIMDRVNPGEWCLYCPAGLSCPIEK